GGDGVTRFTVPRGGTAPIRDPAVLAQLATPFDTFAYTADVKPAIGDKLHINLPDLAIFLWRLAAYPLRRPRPPAKGVAALGPPPAGLARFAVHFDLDPLDRPVRLFNVGSAGFKRAAPSGIVSPLTDADAVPGPIFHARLTSGDAAGHPDAYAHVGFFDDGPAPPIGFELVDVGL